MKKTIWSSSTYFEKIDILNNFYKNNQEKNPLSATLAKELANTIEKALKIGAEKSLYVVDEVIETSCFLARNRVVSAEAYEKNNIGPGKILAHIKPKMLKFNISQIDYEKAIIFVKYINDQYNQAKQKELN